MDLADLPEYCVVEVAQYLSVTDIVACSGVSKRWRSAFDKNSIWWRYHTINRHYFSKQVSQLGQEEVCEGCEAKRHVFRELTVLRNIYKSNFHQTRFETGKIESYFVTDTVDETGHHWLFILGHKITGVDESELQLQMWNLNGDPVLHTSIIIEEPGKLYIRNMEAHGRKIILTFSEEVHVYRICPENLLRFAFKVVIPRQLFQLPQFTYINNKILGFLPLKSSSSGCLPPYAQVWNEEGKLLFDSGPCVAPEKENYSSSSVGLERCKNNSKYVSLSTRNRGMRDRSSLYLFNIDQFQYIKIWSIEMAECFKHGISSSYVCLAYKFEDSTEVVKVKIFNFEGIEVYNTTLEKGVTIRKFFSGSSDQEILLLCYDQVIVVNVCDGKQVSGFKYTPGSSLRGLVATVKENFLVNQWNVGRRSIVKIWNYKTGQCFDYLTTALVGYLCYSYSFYKNCPFPPKIIAVENESERSNVLVLSFW